MVSRKQEPARRVGWVNLRMSADQRADLDAFVALQNACEAAEGSAARVTPSDVVRAALAEYVGGRRLGLRARAKRLGVRT